MTAFKLRPIIIGTLIVGLLSLAALAAAQDGLPTKTPSPTPPASTTENTAPRQSVQSAPLEEPFIQADLNILSGNVQRPNGLFWHNGKVYASCNGDWTLYEIDAETGATITYLWGIRNAHTLYVEDDATGVGLWVPDFQTNQLVHVVQRTMQTVATGLNGPWGIAPLDDRFLITNLLGNNIVSVTRDGAIEEVVGGLRSPAGLVVVDDAVYVANNGSARRAIEWIDRDSLSGSDVINASAVITPQPLVSGLQNPTGLTMGPDGLLYVSYALGTRGVIGRVDPVMCRENGGCTNNEVEIVVYTDLAAPLAGLAISPDMRLYTHTIFSPDIYFADLGTDERTTTRR
ncbi:MAG: hypothetical protein AAFU54_22110 [Chloroflexota bacterium]